jgi:glutathione S-transferase
MHDKRPVISPLPPSRQKRLPRGQCQPSAGEIGPKMPQILYSSASPFAAKARMIATHIGFAYEAVAVKTDEMPANLLAANPLGKIPALVTDAGQGVFDSKVITQYLNRVSGGKVLPKNAEKRLEAEMLESLADGIADCAVACIYEKRLRPEDKYYQPWVDKQWGKVLRGLDLLESSGPKLPAKIHGGHIALAACLGYLTLRFPDWSKGRPKLKNWQKKFSSKHADIAALLPQ